MVLLQQIGEGGFAFVYRCKDCRTKEHFAIKKMLCQSEEQFAVAEKEIRTLRDLQRANHPNICQLVDVAIETTKQGDRVVLLLLPLYEGG
jgi:serine/threonine protein kinase